MESLKKTCASCGTELSETDLFCKKCGGKPSCEEVAIEQVDKSATYKCELKKFTGSPLFLALAILVSITGIVGLFDFKLISFITYILLIAGCWSLWAKSKKDSGDPTQGIKTIKLAVKFNQIIVIIKAVLLMLILTVVFVAALLGAEFINNFIEVNVTKFAGILLLSIVMVISVIFVLINLYYKPILKFFNNLLQSIKKDEDCAAQKAMRPAITIFIFSIFPLIKITLKGIRDSFINKILVQIVDYIPAEAYRIVAEFLKSSRTETLIILLGVLVTIFGGVLLMLYKSKFSKKTN